MAEVLVERGYNTVALRTVANPGAKFSDKGYATLVQRSRKATKSRQPSPCGATFRAASDEAFGTSLRYRPPPPRKLEAVNPQFSAVIQDAVAEGAIMIMDKVDIASQNLADAGRDIQSLHVAGQLSEKELLEFAATGQTV